MEGQPYALFFWGFFFAGGGCTNVNQKQPLTLFSFFSCYCKYLEELHQLSSLSFFQTEDDENYYLRDGEEFEGFEDKDKNFGKGKSQEPAPGLTISNVSRFLMLLTKKKKTFQQIFFITKTQNLLATTLFT